MALTDRQRRFVVEYLIDLNATQAAIRSGYSQKTARQIGDRLLSNVDVKAAVQEAQQARTKRTEITADKVLDRLWQIATADPNDLVQYRRDNCRHCWGAGHQYQWTEAEFERAQREAEEKGNDPPAADGGFGFISTREPNPECPECSGEGRGKIFVSDTRRVKGAARLLYAGVKQGKEGLELKMHDQLAALNKVAEHIGLFRDSAAMRRAEEMHRAELAAKQAATDKIRRDLDEGDDDKPAPVQIVVEVKDARKRGDDAKP
ncbi:terminase small subunit [Chromobacterium haemolyticum]|uniref:terminase small subunit n=1 Tax=Chromobacterium TaxID=535 RepID=UPI004057900F